MELRYVPMDKQIADVFTKSLGRRKFVSFRDKLEIVENVSLAEREC